MGVDDIIMRGQGREDHLWTPFAHDPFGFVAREKRAVLFGLYANGFNHGFAYLVDISGEKLVNLVNQFDTNMAQLDADEQQTVMELATKRYLDVLDQQIHDQKMVTGRSKIDAQDAEFDAKFAALEQDRLAIATKREQLAQAIAKAEAEVQVLTARIAEAEINREYVEADISRKKLEATRTRLQVLEAGNRGLSLQYDIANTAVQEADLRLDRQRTQQQVDLIPGNLAEIEAADRNLDADIVHAGTNRAMVDAEVAEYKVKATRTELDATGKEVDASLLDVDIAKAKLDTAMVDVEIEETEVKTAREEARKIELQTDIAMVEVQIAQTQLEADKVRVQLKEIEADIATLDAKKMRESLLTLERRIAETRRHNLAHEIPRKRQVQLDAVAAQIDVLRTKIDAAVEYKELEQKIHGSRQDQQQAEHTYKMTMAELDQEFDMHRAVVKLESFSRDLLIAAKERAGQELQDQEVTRVPHSQVNAAVDSKRAAIDAAKTMAAANIINTLTHKIGKG
ncbi:MAG: hypothetical protein JEZ12_13030 [Desulfobacterium sp.]|nr:hypothetical protein [Desulfobacterium sp.]